MKQRIVGALVLLALAVIFLPMLLSREDEMQPVVVDAPAMPQAPSMPQIEMQPVIVPEPQLLPEEPEDSLAPLPIWRRFRYPRRLSRWRPLPHQ
ncbi:hypothetical protein D3C86_1870920 [compost metagenome]